VGGLTDDYKYLVGAHCLSCVPTNHWESRFLIVWPTGAAIKLFGLNFWSVMIVPVAASMLAVLLLYKIVDRQFGRGSATIACCILVLTPIFGERSMRIGVDVPEFTALLAAIFVLQRRYWGGWAGILLAIAVLTRPTELAILPMVGFLAWTLSRESFMWCVGAFLTTVILQMLAYWVFVGDPLYFWTLALHHTKIPSWLLSSDVDTSRSPLFNPDFIGGWVPSAGIHTHWTIQGLVNLLVNKDMAATLWTGIVFSALSFRHLSRVQVGLLIGSALYFGVLTYAFAIDPEPRMFLPVAAAAAVLAGTLTPRLLAGPSKVVVITFFVLIGLIGIAGIRGRNDYSRGAFEAARLMSAGSYEFTSRARERMSLVHWNVQSRPGHLVDIDHHCRPALRGRRLLAQGKDICIYE
jgi:4-amino-4-deoxy-L-arabinose transferase-like glycosyltransferase